MSISVNRSVLVSRRSVCGGLWTVQLTRESSGLSSARRGVDGRSDFRGVRFDASPKYRRMHSVQSR